MNWTFAQQALPTLDPNEFLRASTVLVVLLGVVGTALLLIRNGQVRREWEHAERLRALEVGQTVPPRDAPWAKAAVCVAIGLGVPALSFGTTLALFHTWSQACNELWIAPAVVSGASVLAASILAGTLFHSGSRPPSTADDTAQRTHSPALKTSHDPDAYDVAGRRG